MFKRGTSCFEQYRIFSTQTIKYAAYYFYINTAISDQMTGDGHTCPDESDPGFRSSRFSSSRTDSWPNGFRFRLGHLQVGDDVIEKRCIALDSQIKFKLWAGIHTGLTLYYIYWESPIPQVGCSSGSHCTKWSMIIIRPAQLMPDIPLSRPHYKNDLVSSLVWREAETNIA